MRGRRALVATAVLALGGTAWWAVPVGAGPTCTDVLDISVHGHHVVADYVMGTGHDTTPWPPAGTVGPAVRGGGPAIPGGPGAKGHLPAGVAPGASFCNPQSASPGWHAGR